MGFSPPRSHLRRLAAAAWPSLPAPALVAAQALPSPRPLLRPLAVLPRVPHGHSGLWTHLELLSDTQELRLQRSNVIWT